MQRITEIIIAIAVVALVLWLGTIAVAQNEQNECVKWQAEARAYAGYYLTAWQKTQCDHYGVAINAPIK